VKTGETTLEPLHKRGWTSSQGKKRGGEQKTGSQARKGLIPLLKRKQTAGQVVAGEEALQKKKRGKVGGKKIEKYPSALNKSTWTGRRQRPEVGLPDRRCGGGGGWEACGEELSITKKSRFNNTKRKKRGGIRTRAGEEKQRYRRSAGPGTKQQGEKKKKAGCRLFSYGSKRKKKKENLCGAWGPQKRSAKKNWVTEGKEIHRKRPSESQSPYPQIRETINQVEKTKKNEKTGVGASENSSWERRDQKKIGGWERRDPKKKHSGEGKRQWGGFLFKKAKGGGGASFTYCRVWGGTGREKIKSRRRRRRGGKGKSREQRGIKLSKTPRGVRRQKRQAWLK